MFSGFDCVFAPANKFTASCCASRRLGAKSPFRIQSELSQTIMVASSGMIYCWKKRLGFGGRDGFTASQRTTEEGRKFDG